MFARRKQHVTLRFAKILNFIDKKKRFNLFFQFIIHNA